MSAIAFYTLITLSVATRAVVWNTPRGRNEGVDVGDLLLLVAMAAYRILRGRDPAVEFGAAGVVLGKTTLAMCAAVVATFALANAWIRRVIRVGHGEWMQRTDVNSGGAYEAVSSLPLPKAALAGLGFTCSGAFLEELLFRGCIYRLVARAAGDCAAMGVQAALFAAVHGIPMACARAPAALVVYAFAMSGGAGMALGWLATHGRGLLYPWLAHWSLNYIALLMALMARNNATGSWRKRNSRVE
ncbi:MAG: CPBP family intramembrane glutamic endopeptidase [Clostridia bacterium]|nr:CPBP family intramembrane glutamic endopeptidase [Clostridia bacterium]